MNSALQVVPSAVLELLALPEFDGLDGDQIRGRACVWCGCGPLTVTAVDFGVRMGSQCRRWYPRSCGPCAGEHAHRGLFQHAPMCEQCVDEAGQCTVGRILYRLIREGRR